MYDVRNGKRITANAVQLRFLFAEGGCVAPRRGYVGGDAGVARGRGCRAGSIDPPRTVASAFARCDTEVSVSCTVDPLGHDAPNSRARYFSTMCLRLVVRD